MLLLFLVLACGSPSLVVVLWSLAVLGEWLAVPVGLLCLSLSLGEEAVALVSSWSLRVAYFLVVVSPSECWLVVASPSECFLVVASRAYPPSSCLSIFCSSIVVTIYLLQM